MAFMDIIMGLGLLFYIRLGFRYSSYEVSSRLKLMQAWGRKGYEEGLL